MITESTVTSLSWIPSESVSGALKLGFTSGVSHYDAPPPDHIEDIFALRDADGFRFANRLHAWVEFDGDRVVRCGQTGGVIMGATTVRVAGLDATFAGVTMPDLRPDPVVGDGFVTFTQTTGGRTACPLPRKTSRPPYLRMRSPIVWSTLELTLRCDGTSDFALTSASPFPRHWVYDDAGDLALKTGVADWPAWTSQPSWTHTPWGDTSTPAMVTAAETALERELSRLIMGGDVRPQVRDLAEGEVLTREGDPGDELMLLLDGVVGVSVGDRQLVELGPGAVLGERAILEGSRRTATLTAATRVRVASVPAYVVDRDALAHLAAGHQRELEMPV
ncbi:cyclic nucleotide-binding domain-containing protein [Nocardioides ultimimeridianus]